MGQLPRSARWESPPTEFVPTVSSCGQAAHNPAENALSAHLQIGRFDAPGSNSRFFNAAVWMRLEEARRYSGKGCFSSGPTTSSEHVPPNANPGSDGHSCWRGSKPTGPVDRRSDPGKSCG